MREVRLEQLAAEHIRKIGGRAFKWICPGVSGVPDRICIFPGGRIIFVEFKRPGLNDGLSPRQKKICGLLERLGCDVRRIGDKNEFMKMMEELGYGEC